MKVSNLYEHADGGYYCLLSDDAPMKHPSTGEWIPGTIYAGTDGRMRSTSTERFAERFKPVAEYTEGDPDVEAMIRRTNPDLDFKMEDVWAAWHEAESAINSQVIELAVCSVLAAFAFNDSSGMSFVLSRDTAGNPEKARITLKPANLRNILINYEITRESVDDGYVFSLSKAG